MKRIIDEVDKKILSLLEFDARMSYTKLGKKLGKTKQYIRARVERLKEKGVITGIDTIIDITKLGYTYMRILIKFGKTTTKSEKEMIEFFKKKKKTAWLITTGGTYDLVASLMIKNINDFEKIFDEFSSKYSEYVDIIETSIATKIWHFSIFKQNKNIITGEKKIEKIDDKDILLLEELYKNGSINSVQLGIKVKLTPAAVLTRLKNLKEKKIILAYRLRIDTEKIGLDHYKIFLKLNNITNNFIKEFITYCSNNKKIIYVTKILGTNKLEIEVLIKNNKEFNELLRELRNNFSEKIKSIEFLEHYQTHLINYLPF